MNMKAFYLAAALAVLIGLAHSVMGERLMRWRLPQRSNSLPVFGDDWIARALLRLTWHVLAFAWCCVAALVVLGAGRF